MKDLQNLSNKKLLELYTNVKKNEIKINKAFFDIRTILIERFKQDGDITEYINNECWGVREITTERLNLDKNLLLELLCEEDYKKVMKKKKSKYIKISKVQPNYCIPKSQQ